MTTRNGAARLNRAVLAVFGSALIAAGGYALAAHYGRLEWVGSRSGLIPDATPPSGVLWAIVGVGCLVALGCVGWAFAQFPRIPRAVRWRGRARDCADTVALDTAVACAPVSADIESYDGVRSAAVRLSGPGSGPGLHLVVTAAPDADVTALRDRIRTHAVPRLRQALELEELPVEMELRLARERSR
ncbi:hypothetical protein [Nocardia miyunensis]|uniref:hypothetical protein n=1 Tax=Nocardia miyunensis TaxID=282684 RepID=UPI00083699DC|nr:hypothetical protein [Nocardia miyunensis]